MGRYDEILVENIVLRHPNAADGCAVNALIAECPPLDRNSVYCNLLHCTHFSRTSVIAETERGTCAGFVSGYVVPEEKDALFIWQVAVAPWVRRMGLGSRMLGYLVKSSPQLGVRRLLTSINPDNPSAQEMFCALAREFRATVKESSWFRSATHFQGRHPDEVLLDIGPLHAGRRPAPLVPLHANSLMNAGVWP